MRGFCLGIFTNVLTILASVCNGVNVTGNGRFVSIENEFIKITYDLKKGYYAGVDIGTGAVLFENARFCIDELTSDKCKNQSWRSEPLDDTIGDGRSLVIRAWNESCPELILAVSLYNQQGFIVLGAGIKNVSQGELHVKSIRPFDGAVAFKNYDDKSVLMLDGYGGMYPTRVGTDPYRTSRNNLLVFGRAGAGMRCLVVGGLTYYDYEKFADARKQYTDGGNSNGNKLACVVVSAYAFDPVGKKVDPGCEYISADRFYVDAVTDDPFRSLEAYAVNVKAAQKINIAMYDFPTVCLWYAGSHHNNTIGAVEEMDRIAKSGFLKYSRAAVRLVPDAYTGNNQQGWWDDKHWQADYNMPLPWGAYGQYKKPYETTKKWASSVIERGGIPLTYFQTGLRSQDYADAYPEHMLFNHSRALYLDAQHKPFKYPKVKDANSANFWKSKALVYESYDYTDPGFVEHMRQVYKNLRDAGVKGLMFDYPDTGWAARGGFEDKYSTTAAAYRNIFRLAYEGLGADCYIDERNLNQGSDVTLGLVASQRIVTDTRELDKNMVKIAALRWYKNRVVTNYDLDSKSLSSALPKNRDGIRAMLTMCYVLSGRLLLGSSFIAMTPEEMHDLSRVVPFHTQPQTARPVDVFIRDCPQIFDFRVNEKWHQLTIWNDDPNNEKIIPVTLAGRQVDGALDMDGLKEYYGYDFWDDSLVGKFKANSPMVVKLRPGQARMISLHEIASVPQVISTNRHIMQGFIDLSDMIWESRSLQLSGTSAVVGQEPYKIVIACNGFTEKKCGVSAGQIVIGIKSQYPKLIELTITRPQNAKIKWNVSFDAP